MHDMILGGLGHLWSQYPVIPLAYDSNGTPCHTWRLFNSPEIATGLICPSSKTIYMGYCVRTWCYVQAGDFSALSASVARFPFISTGFAYPFMGIQNLLQTDKMQMKMMSPAGPMQVGEF